MERSLLLSYAPPVQETRNADLGGKLGERKRKAVDLTPFSFKMRAGITSSENI